MTLIAGTSTLRSRFTRSGNAPEFRTTSSARSAPTASGSSTRRPSSAPRRNRARPLPTAVECGAWRASASAPTCGPVRGDRRAGRRAQLELPRLVRGGAGRLSGGVRRRLLGDPRRRASSPSCSSRTSATCSRRTSTTGCASTPASASSAARASASTTRSRASGEVIADGWTSHACVDAKTLRPTRIPQALADAIARAEASS